MVVGEAQAELAVDLGLVVRVGVAQDGEDPAEAVDEFSDLLTGKASWPRTCGAHAQDQGG
jgi:hypothetical protein